MDIRDIKEVVPDIYGGNGLEQMFKLQIELLNKYRKVEVGGLPEFPINIHERESQILIKDFIARVVEELGEAHESYIEMVALYDANKADDEMMVNHLQNFNEELSDALHFILELFVYCNIGASDILNYYEELLKAREWKDAFFFPDNILKTVLVYARQCNIEAQTLPNSFQGFKVLDDEKVLKDEFLRGGRKVSVYFLDQHKLLLWDITYHLNKARNLLKNKPWKQTEMLTDENRFQEELMESWLHLFRYFDFIEMTDESLFTIYFKKNKVNMFRIESKY